MFEFLRRLSPLWARASFNRPNFNRLWAAQALSAFGNRITRTALPIIAIAVLAATPGEAAILSAVSLAPVILAGLLGGGFVERSNKLRLMVTMDLVRFAVVIVAPIAWYFDVLSFPLLCGIAAVSGLASALFANADISILPRLVGKDDLVEANSRLQATESIAELTGPGVAGVLVDLLTAPVAMIADALTFLWSAFWLWRIPKEAGRPPESIEPAVQAAPLSNSLERPDRRLPRRRPPPTASRHPDGGRLLLHRRRLFLCAVHDLHAARTETLRRHRRRHHLGRRGKRAARLADGEAAGKAHRLRAGARLRLHAECGWSSCC